MKRQLLYGLRLVFQNEQRLDTALLFIFTGLGLFLIGFGA